MLCEKNDFVDGTVTRTASFGAFVKLGEKLEGLIHISELSNKHVDKVTDVVKEGEKITAKIIKLHVEDQKIGLSLKQDEGSDNYTEAEVEQSVEKKTQVEAEEAIEAES